MATAVITVASGGLPVTDVTASAPLRGMAVTEATGTVKYGIPVTKITNGLPVTFVAVAGGAAAATPALWSQTDHLEMVTVNAAGTVATRNSTLGGANALVRSDTSQSAGIRYIEITILEIGNGMRLGVCNQVIGLSNQMGADATGYSIGYGNAGNMLKGGGFTGSLAPASYTTGDVIGMVVDCDADTIKFYKNNVVTGDASYSIASIGANVFVGASLGDSATFCSVQINGA